jgi:hypothetical protein
MTLVSTIITDAYRQSNLIAVGTTETTAQQTEALRYLSRIVKGVFGAEAGENLEAFPIGSTNINRPSGYPWWNTVPDDTDWFVPENIRVMLNLSQSVTLYLHPEPDDGSRFAAIDVAGTLSTNPVTIYGNGRLIENAQSITLNTDNANSEWFYRSDMANWQKYAPIAIDDTFPFPEEFDDYFITMLALRINPSYGAMIDDQSNAMLRKVSRQLKARYRSKIPQRSELGLIRMPVVSADREFLTNDYTIYNPNTLFDKGWPI